VHAPDPELALLNARDVFVRRPECSALWVVPAEAIYSRTAEEIQSQGIRPEAGEATGEKTFHIFCKRRSAGKQTLIGSIRAGTPLQALQAALAVYAPNQPAFCWWVIPEDSFTRSEPDEIDSLFAPARDKGFRLSTDFHTHSAMRAIKKP
jgi:ring-1,2-phenylacetyl-CoA epoxidase subunit PaaB